MTRLYIANVVRVVSQFVATPTTVHLGVVFWILVYLWGAQFQTLVFSSMSYLELRVYCDVDWDNGRNRLLDILISWKSKKHNVTSRLLQKPSIVPWLWLLVRLLSYDQRKLIQYTLTKQKTLMLIWANMYICYNEPKLSDLAIIN